METCPHREYIKSLFKNCYVDGYSARWIELHSRLSKKKSKNPRKLQFIRIHFQNGNVEVYHGFPISTIYGPCPSKKEIEDYIEANILQNSVHTLAISEG